jgi:hypothetical protein
VVYDAAGKEVLVTGGSGVDVSPGRRFGAVFPTVFADANVVTLYDLGTGARVATQPLAHDAVVDSVAWDEAHYAVVFSLRDRAGAPDTRTVPLPPSPAG